MATLSKAKTARRPLQQLTPEPILHWQGFVDADCTVFGAH
jgi:hypothetical protein